MGFASDRMGPHGCPECRKEWEIKRIMPVCPCLPPHTWNGKNCSACLRFKAGGATKQLLAALARFIRALLNATLAR